MEISKDIGPEAKVQLSVAKGKLVLSIKHQGASGVEDINVEEDLGYFIDQLVSKLPEGTVKNILAQAAALAKVAMQNL